jgi:tetratricopeptide (TPR) repeat protein
MRIALLAFALALIAPAPALADAPPPTPEQLEAAKKAFADGKKLHTEGKYAEAIEKFKESYRLSRNPLLLYNIGFTMDEAKEADMALYYYRKFLKEAPPEAEQRALATERVKVLEAQITPPPAAPEQVTPAQPDGPKQPLVIKPPGTYGATDFEHVNIDTAPPAKPLDITAFVPEDSGFTVTLFFRTAGEGKYTSKPMNWRYKELVGRIPAPKMIGSAVHYYLEVKDTTGAIVTRSGKSTSPNLVNLEAGATPRFYPDLSEDGETVLSDSEIRSRDDEDDPLNRNKKKPEPAPRLVVTGPPPPPGTGFRDVGSQKFVYSKWGTTGTAAALIGLSVVFYIQAGKYSRSVETDIEECGAPPCLTYDQYAIDLAAAGKRYQTLSQVSFGVGLAVSAVAGYFWLKEYRAKQRGELPVATKASAKAEAATSWGVAPVIGDGAGGLIGATAARRF